MAGAESGSGCVVPNKIGHDEAARVGRMNCETLTPVGIVSREGAGKLGQSGAA